MLSTYGAGTIGFYVDMKGELSKLDFIEIEKYASQKILLKIRKDIDWRSILSKHILITCIYRIYKELSKSII